MTSRRKFVRDSGIVLGTSMIPGVLHARPATVAPSDQVRVGVIGCNGMGFQNLLSALKIPEVECGALCDVDASVLNRRANEVEQRTGTRPTLYSDFREVLDDDDIDAVII
ncbi:MAG: gfo/Idh/MocA family oxidoreductase, partial [Gemmatimonadota bacterium]